MTHLGTLRFRLWFPLITCVLLLAGAIWPQEITDSGLEMTTQERLETEAWWPTMGTAPLDAYAGSASCAQCHKEGTDLTSMRRAAEVAKDAHFLKGVALQVESTPFRYALAADQHGLAYTVTSGKDKLSQELAWVIGAGDLARTFLYQRDGRWQQSEVSFYTRPGSLDITTGLGRSGSQGLPAALGQPLSAQDARSCFGCHTVHASTSAGLDPLHAEAGLGCEACHGPAHEHVSLMERQAGNHAATTPATSLESDAVFDPSRLSPQDSIDFCGSCHRTSADAKLSVTQDFRGSVVRFQPYRLEESKCWRATKDARLTCVACHNPHKPLEADALSYDSHCLQCHTGTAHSATPAQQARVCPKATSNCVSCHMPKVTVATMHGDFTDHYIPRGTSGRSATALIVPAHRRANCRAISDC